MKKAIIGKAAGKDLGIDLEKLMRTRLLIQANSGGGKSYLIRKLLEETHGKVQHIVLDLEGDFATLREKFDYLLIGKDGDIPIDIRSAELLAKKLLEHNISAILDLYELKPLERILFVKKFLDTMVNAKKELWHPVLVVVDEVHKLCPESKFGKAESKDSVIDLATLGRKRGYCAVLATQRLAKLHKDAAAECNNKLIGRTGLDIDRKRASQELGFTSKEQEISLRDLDEGEFFAFGPAISKEIVKVKIGKVKTTHLEAGMGINIKSVIPKPMGNSIRLILSKLADLPKKAEEELHEKEDLKRKIRELQVQLRKGAVAPVASVASVIPVKNKNDIINARAQGYSAAKKHYDFEFNKMRQTLYSLKHMAQIINSNSAKALKLISIPEKVLIYNNKENIPTASKSVALLDREYGIGQNSGHVVATETPSMSSSMKAMPKASIPKGPITADAPEEEVVLGQCERGVYSLLYNNPERDFLVQQVALFAGYSHTSGGFKNAISRLNAFGLISKDQKEVHVDIGKMDWGRQLLRKDVNLHEKFTIKNWAQKLPKCESAIFSFLLENQGQKFSKEQLGEQLEYSPSSGGFKNAISRLNALGLIKKNNGLIRFNEEVSEGY